VRSDEALPARADVVIVGGGIVGVSAALFLARKGVSVTLAEKGVIGGEQSSRNWGWCRVTLRDPSEIPLMQESLRLWQDRRLLGDADTGFRTTGIMYLCGRSANDAENYEAWLDRVRPFQLGSRMLGSAEVARLLPGAARTWPGALYTPGDGGAEPERAAPAIAEAARRHGATVLTGCAVRGIERQGGRVSGVVTERGPIACGAVLVAAGAWSRLFCGSFGVDLPQLKVLGSAMRTAPLPGGPDVSTAGTGFGFRKREAGGYIVSQAGATAFDIVPDAFRLFRGYWPLLRRSAAGLRLRLGSRFVEEWRTPRVWKLDAPSPFERVRVLDPPPSRATLDAAARNIAAAYPLFAKMRVVARWGGMIDVTPDELPVISPVEGLPGLYLATGFSGHGFGIGPGAGKLAADMVAGDPTTVDATAFRLSRFAN
jgi:glycine/D-amino acid oxidase-like deaminating enzyme